MGTYIAVLTGVVGCGPSAPEFVVAYADAYCGAFLECAEPGALLFDGIASIDDCLAVAGPPVLEQSQQCTLKAQDAAECLSSMDILVCPPEGVAFDDVLPGVCATVWHKCSGSGVETSNEDTG